MLLNFYFELNRLVGGQTLMIEILYNLYGCIDIVFDAKTIWKNI